jgi:hypothetical protein
MDNINFLMPTGFSIYIDKIPETLFRCTELEIPQIISNFTIINTPMIDYPVPGEKLEYGILTITFIVDEEMKNFLELSSWLMNMSNPESLDNNDRYLSYHMFNNFSTNFSDGILTIFTNNNHPNIQIQILDMFPISVSAISLQTDVDGIQYKSCTSTFKLSHLKFL